MRSRVFNKILVQIVDMMVTIGSSDHQDKAVLKPRYSSKQLETAMTAPINKKELTKRIRNG